MKNLRKETAIYIQLAGFVVIWTLVLFVSGVELKINWEALRKLPEVVTIYYALQLLFTSWAWRLPLFQSWLVPFPDLQGTWVGTVQSTWPEPTAAPPKPIPIIIVIRQSFYSISCFMYSQESTSFSSAAQLMGEEDGLPLHLSFNYSNRPKSSVREHSQMHYGAAILRVVQRPERVLEGDYWTDRRTRGDLQVLFKSRDLTDRFSM
jgi:predicted pore-forming effector associated with SMODS systems